MKSFEPVYFGNCHRYVAICKEDMIFVGDAETYDKDHKDRATVVFAAKLEEIADMRELVTCFNESDWYPVDNPYRLWMVETDKISLIMLHKAYTGQTFVEYTL